MTKRENEKFFLVVWDQMVKRYYNEQTSSESYTFYREWANDLFGDLFCLKMAFCSEMEYGFDPEECDK